MPSPDSTRGKGHEESPQELITEHLTALNIDTLVPTPPSPEELTKIRESLPLEVLRLLHEAIPEAGDPDIRLFPLVAACVQITNTDAVRRMQGKSYVTRSETMAFTDGTQEISKPEEIVDDFGTTKITKTLITGATIIIQQISRTTEKNEQITKGKSDLCIFAKNPKPLAQYIVSLRNRNK